MEEVLARLRLPLAQGSSFQVWMLLAAGLALLLLLILFAVLTKRRKSTPPPVPITFQKQKAASAVLEVSNLQGMGAREEQQDAFAISPLESYSKDGLLMVLCDGMGGMVDGGTIAAETVSWLMSTFPREDPDAAAKWIATWSRKVHQRFLGQGGTTLVAAFVKEDNLYFWCLGDSDLFLLRDGFLYALHVSQNYRNQLVLRALAGALAVEDAFSDEQAAALSQYIGKADVTCAYTHIPCKLQGKDTLLLCSDGISNALSLTRIREALAFPAPAAADLLEAAILSKADPLQDNYTAIIMKYIG